jgi:hypothetical protein
LGIFVLAEVLHKPVYELEANMPFTEYAKWSIYFKQKNEEQEREAKHGSKNLLDSETNLLKGLVG